MTFNERKRIRLKQYDYSKPGFYFVTICCQARTCWFGEILRGEMRLNEMGKIAKETLLEMQKNNSKVSVTDYVIMPDHVHLIVEIREGNHSKLSTVVGSYKAAASKRFGRLADFKGSTLWQRGYYEHIIRGERSCNEIRKCMRENPNIWTEHHGNAF